MVECEYDGVSAREGARSLLNRRNGPTAIVCTGDLHGLAAIGGGALPRERFSPMTYTGSRRPPATKRTNAVGTVVRKAVEVATSLDPHYSQPDILKKTGGLGKASLRDTSLPQALR
jgi:hypothetical protein